MNMADMGTVFAYLQHWRVIAGNPPGRNYRDGEKDVARILANCNAADLADLDDFLGAQGFQLIERNGMEFGIPAKPGVPNAIWVLTRKRGTSLPAYVDSRWYVERMRDGRGGDSDAKRHETVFWVTRLWLTLQWFFYQKIDRHPAEVSRYREAMVSRRLFVDILKSGIEEMGNTGRPAGEAGIVFDYFWKEAGKVSQWASRFLTVMEEAGMIEPSGNRDEWNQSVLAAIEMADIAAHEIAYLLPPTERSAMVETAALLMGEAPSALRAHPPQQEQ
ncbi:hypothetical protein [Ralstonia solanacearum]|uniref:Uncharacterized protein n=1 Tax=Ralstonia solanacearum TaxID=305 RepID=A0AAE3NIT0_RALSL|nr:hypothetical protein [Ralstonia solanacearum]MBB6582216.1 hypothetical protein [Ralstonia solanacearum]MDB0522695.1 hypothetical protein [Ralstonia solanacearum]